MSTRGQNPTKSCFCVDMVNVFTLLMLLIIREGSGNSGWSVTFENPNPCALKGNSVEFRCSYSYREGETVRNTTWYRGKLNGTIWTRVALSDLPSYENRSEYLGDRQHNCSLAIHDLQVNDTGYYYFRFDTDTYGFRSKKSVYLSVTELNVIVYPERVRAGEIVTLECKTSCHQPSDTAWFKDGRPISKTVFLAQAEDSGNYVCAIRGRESEQSDSVALDVQYGPLNTSIEVSKLGHLSNSPSVNLTCRATANPAAINYTWYRTTGSNSGSMVHVGSGQVLSLTSVVLPHSGLYLCQARNSVGENNLTKSVLIVDHEDINHFILVGIVVKIGLVLLLTLIIIWIGKKTCYSAEDKKEQEDHLENASNHANG
ncbi:B-cell receptor CD22-like isoform X2 [Solea solea]|uniref:B-cell receptor CD22-like isoform X2 n=1 Tax=Solea solea TaxID=90069 RepID=UPI00272BDB6F|nr:B-cell receptor CD22-like isoform X2 [Solea solea]